MAIITLSAIQALLRPGLAAVFGDYMTYPDQWKEIFTSHVSNKAVEYEVEMRLLPMAQFKPDGGAVQYGDMAQQYTTSYLHRNFGIGFQITANTIRDNLYKDAWPRATESGKDSMRQAKNIEGAAILNNGFNANFPVSDGQPLFSTVHPVMGNVVPNTFAVPTQLNETGLQDALIGIQKFLSASGLRIALGAEKLIVPPELQFTSDVLLGSKYRTATANNDINAIYNLSSVPMGYRVNQFLSNPSAWFLITNEANGFKYYERDPLSIDMFTDTTTRNLNVTFVERYSFGSSNWRAGFGSQGV
jgi:phage major head subunit gpT-like protein